MWLLLAGLGRAALRPVFIDLRLGHVLVLGADHAEHRGGNARAIRHRTELLGTAASRRRRDLGARDDGTTGTAGSRAGAVRESGGHGLLNPTNAVGFDGGDNLTNESFNQ